MKGSITSDDIKALLNEKYSDGEKCLIAFEVNEGTGASSGRRIDALAMHLWPSNDYKIIGFEIKVARSDWLNEMKQPDKSLALSKYCDEFYLVAPYGVLGIDELPKTWGYIQATDERIFTKIKAPKREASEIERPFMASFMRQITRKYSDKKLLTAQIEKVKEKLHNEFDDRNDNRIKRLEEQLAEKELLIQNFNRDTGLTMNKWNYGNIVQAINILKNVETREKYIADITNKITMLKNITAGDEKTLEILKNLKLE
jgi:hypothetical protein